MFKESAPSWHDEEACSRVRHVTNTYVASSSLSLKRSLNVDSAIAIIEMSLKYFIFGFYTSKM